MSKEKPKFVRFIAKPLYKFFYLNPRVKMVKEDGGLLDKMEGPAIIVGNHVHSLDPLFINAAIKPHVRWVAGAHLFKRKIAGPAIKHLATCIPKQQGRSDLTTIKNISKALKNNAIVGLFPEGTRTWDGDTYDIDFKATAKLFRIFKVPVYFVSLEGGYDLHPRWADEKRKGTLVIRLKKVLSVEELKSYKLDDLMKITKENLYYNHEEWQKKTNRAFTCKNRAHGIQRLLYVCPKCHSIQTIYGNHHSICCSSCKTEDILTDQTLLKDGTFGFNTLADWNKFQKQYILENKIIYKEDKGDFYKKGKDSTHFEMLSTQYKCKLEEDKIIFSLDNGKKDIYEFEKIESMVLSVQQSVEFYYESQLYSFRLQPELNSLKYKQQWEAFNARV